MSTDVTVSFVDSTTIQLRFELGEIDQAAVTTDIPDDINVNESDGYAFSQSDSSLVGRVVGGEGQYFMPYDTYTPSVIEDLFEWTETNGIRSAEVDDLGRWTVEIGGQEVQVTGISRKASIAETATIGWSRDWSTVHNVYLELASPMAEGASIEVSFDDPDFEPIAATYTPETTISEAIHVNLTGYDPDDGIKIATLSSWNGFEYDPGLERGGEGRPQLYTAGMDFDVVDDATGAIVLSGQTELAQALDQGTNFWQNYANAPVLAMDISDLNAEGSYHIVVDEVGRSQSFTLDDDHWGEVFEFVFQGYYHQRSGIALTEEHTEWVRPRAMHPEDGITVRATTVKITETSEAWDGSLPKPFEFWEGNLTGEIVTDAWGGWHDAGDFDRRTQHMETSRKLIELHELHEDWSEGFQGNIPENANGIPDLIDEAIWGTEVLRRLQHDDGGVPGGIESASYGSYGDGSFTDLRDLYVYAPDAWSSWEYAATAAKISRALEPFDPGEAAAWLDSAVAAFNWAEANAPPPEEYDNGFYPRARNIAAAELYEATGEAGYASVFAQTFVYASGDGVEWFEQQYEAAFVAASSDQPGLDPALKALAQEVLQDRADWLLENGTNSGFGIVMDPYAPYGWGNTASQPTNSSEILLRVHALTGGQQYLDAALRDVDYAFGANPMNMSFVTGLDQIVPGARQAEEILDGDNDVLGEDPPPGITLYGEYNVYDYGWNFYHSDMWEYTWPNYYDAPVHESWNGHYSFVPVTEFTVMQGMEDMTFVTGYLAALASDGQPGTTTNRVDDTDGTHSWSHYVDTLDANGDRLSRAVFFDDGTEAVTSYENGIRSGAVRTDPTDVRAWSSITQTFDGTGEIEGQTRVYDDGRVFETTYSGGVRATETVQDAGNAFGWDSYADSFDFNGVRTARVLTSDDGRVSETAYVGGARVRKITRDASEIASWDTIDRTYDPATGLMTNQVNTYDDGFVLELEFVGGQRRTVTATDVNDDHNWQSWVDTYDTDGIRVSRTTTLDDGHQVTVDFGEIA